MGGNPAIDVQMAVKVALGVEINITDFINILCIYFSSFANPMPQLALM